MSNGIVSVKDIYRRLSTPLWGLLIFSVLTISGLVLIATHGQDRNAIKASEHLAHAAIEATERKLSGLMLEYAYWDQAVDKLVTKLDNVWADDNIGPYLLDTYDLSSSYVLGANNQVIFGSTKGGRVAPAPLSHYSGGLDVLISKARSGSPTAAPEPVTGIINASELLYVASVSVLTTYFVKDGQEIHQGTDFVLVFIKRINVDLLSDLAENYLLHKLHFESTDKNDSVASISIFSADGLQIAKLAWEPDLPGEKILPLMLLGTVGVFVLMAWTMFIFLRRAMNFSQELSTKSELLKTTLDSIDQGIAAWDDQNKLLAWNSKCEGFWLTPTSVQVGMTKRELMGHLGNVGELGLGDSDEVAEQRYQEILQAGANTSDEFTLQDGRYISLFRYPMPSGGHTTVYSDITDRKMAEEKLQQQATVDPVTGLPNRVVLYDRISQAIEHTRRTDGNFGLIFVDVDFFKKINDNLGHAAGDKILKKIGERLRQLVRDEDTVARLGGDEYVILLNEVELPNGTEAVAEKIIEAFKVPIDIGENYVPVTVSIGLALYPENGDDTESLLQNADAAMYVSKQQGRNTFRTFSSG